MRIDRLPFGTRVAIVALAFVLVGIVGYVDGVSSAYIAFSIFYVVPISLAAWCGNRVTGVLAAVASAFAGLAADVWSIGAATGVAYVNLSCRLMLFVLIALLISRNKEMVARERDLADRERETARRLRELNDVKDELMHSVAIDARAPLGDIYARIVTLGFDMPKLTTEETREVLNEVADASRRLSALVNNLLQTESVPSDPTVGAAR